MYKLRIASKCDQFRRAGFVFTREGRDFHVGELTEPQLRAIAEESMLAVTVLSADEPENDPGAASSDKPAKKVR
ncbi:HI1506-related protein [Tahibacter soli]|uniref:HI1506-related protein n=1 Tax=Tahibacter soli TaxID=2983605 RepID=A0A9X3YID7_9GAMM|nr:HI1506-related protein [Tahibacter soli]MDC8012936.1 HI1506-related protein [Tahibacter soli]